jgi:thioredoxin-like negative regulator of GroEL
VDQHDRPRRRQLGRLGHTLLVVGVAAVLVVAIALLVRLWDNDPTEAATGLEGPLVSVVTGTTDELTPAESSTDPTVAPAPDRVQPSQEEWEALLPRLQAILDADPDDVNALRKLALAYYNLGRLDEAAAIYEDLLTADEDAVLRNRLGNTLRDMGDVSDAETAYRKAIADDPSLAPHYLNLAELLWHQGRDDEALAVIDEGLKAVPEENRAALEEGREVLERTSG